MGVVSFLIPLTKTSTCNSTPTNEGSSSMASSACSATLPSTSLSSSAIFSAPKPEFCDTHIVVCSKRPFVALRSGKWSSRASFFSGFRAKAKDIESLKQELLAAIQPLDRGADATTEDQLRIDEIAREIEEQNKIKNPLNSNLLNGKWELLYTTSQSVLKTQRPKLLRPNGKIYQAINVDTLRAQNMETWPFFNQATANLVPLNSRRVAVKFDVFKISGLIRIKSPGSGRGQLEITYLDEELRISRGDRGSLFILKMVDPFYKVPL